ncbi:MAG: hypothetical protein Q4D14_04590, partial [Bacteroidales bacterium]|nr:hypothetical protein [Bacteroidales bacterium]
MKRYVSKTKHYILISVLSLISHICIHAETWSWSCSAPALGYDSGINRRLDLTFIPEQNWEAIPINTKFNFNYRENDTANFNLLDLDQRLFFFTIIDSLNYLYSHLTRTDTCICTLDQQFVSDTKIK